MLRPKNYRPAPIGRRRFIALTAGGAGAALFTAACGSDDTPAPAATAAVTTAATASSGQVLVGDVIEHVLSSDEWAGEFGFVKFKLHAGVVDGEPAYYIRTDASDEAFARAEQLVFVPKLAKALAAGAGFAKLYVFDGGADGQLPVLSSAPHRDDFSPLFRLHRVSFSGAATKLDSVAAIEAAEAGGTASVETTDILLNYPVVKWPGGEMPHDEVRDAYLGDGQLLEPVDVAGGTVTFKLHACYPNSRYIVTDVSAPPMSAGMNIAPSPGSAPLTDAGATAQILVFGNGVAGSGPMGFQKSITDTLAGEAEWSPLWDHYTFVWNEAGAAEVLKNNGELLAKEQSGDLKRFPGTPDTNGQIFIVNCPVPVTAPVA